MNLKILRFPTQISTEPIKRHGPCVLAKGEYRPFETLATSIISQQLSAKAAETIEKRVVSVVRSMEPASFVGIQVAELRQTGISSAKARYILELATRVRDGRLNFDSFAHQSDEEVIDALIELPGVGRWTAEMFLIFGLKRPDVLALDDAGLQRSARLLYGDVAELSAIRHRWQPFCSVASWYLWRHLDTPKQILK